MAQKTNKVVTKKPSVLTITLATIASCIVSVALYIGIVWVLETLENPLSTSSQDDLMLLLVVIGLVVAPTLIAAIIVSILLKRCSKR